MPTPTGRNRLFDLFMMGTQAAGRGEQPEQTGYMLPFSQYSNGGVLPSVPGVVPHVNSLADQAIRYVAPVQQNESGWPVPAVPQAITDTWNAMTGGMSRDPQQFNSASPEQRQGYDKQNIMDAMMVAGAAGTGSLAATRPANSLGMGGKVASDGLDMSHAARMARAKEMGFSDDTVYHGTFKDFPAFSLAQGGQVSGSRAGSLGVSVALEPSVADEFAYAAAGGSWDGSRVLPLRYRSNRQGRIHLDGSEKNLEVAATLEDAFDAGYDSVKMHNYTTPNGLTNQQIVLVKNPNQLRSVNAAFDPAKKNSANLLASRGLPIFPWQESDK